MQSMKNQHGYTRWTADMVWKADPFPFLFFVPSATFTTTANAYE